MTSAWTSERIAEAFLRACRAELTALKPGNVHIHAGGHGMDVATFESAAIAAAPHVVDASLTTGARIRRAVEASMTAAGCNTNLGILLLCVPLAVAAMASDEGNLRNRLEFVLNTLNHHDTEDVFAAIRTANPGGLGTSNEADVAAPPAIPLLEAMAIAAPRDRIAANYVSGFRDIFEDHLPLLTRTIKGTADSPPPTRDDAVATLYMSILARFPDSHIRRKYGMETAAHVQHLARSARAHWSHVVQPSNYAELLKLDALLKFERWNPGTTADFVVATAFAAEIDDKLDH